MVQSKVGVRGAFEIIGAFLCGAVFVLAVYRGYAATGTFGFSGYATLAIAVVLFYLGVTTMFERVEVSLERTRISRFGRETIYLYADMSQVELSLYGYGTSNYNIAMEPLDERSNGMSVGVKGYSNKDEIARAIIEAAWRANPSIRIGPNALARFGRPPYGIFRSPHAP